MATGSMLRTWWWMLAVAGLGALPAQAQRVSLTDLQNQIAALQNQIAASATCPAALPGQPRFVDKGDGTICDSATGLVWEKKLECAEPTNPRCVDNRYTWSASSPYMAPTGSLHSDFLARLNYLNGGTTFWPFSLCFLKHCDWRIPTIEELRSIINVEFPDCTVSPCIDPIFGPAFRGHYWSSSTNGDLQYVTTINFSIGSLGVVFKGVAIGARAVRGGR